MKEIILPCSSVTRVSDEDFLYLATFNWCRSGDGLYVSRLCQKHWIYLHEVVLNRAGKVKLLGQEGDHIDRDVLNNQRDNLRYVSESQNKHNRKVFRTSSSGVTGVRYDFTRDKWIAKIEINKRKNLSRTIFLI